MGDGDSSREDERFAGKGKQELGEAGFSSWQ